MFEMAMFLEAFEKLVEKAHGNSKAKGFWGDQSDPVEKLKELCPTVNLYPGQAEWLRQLHAPWNFGEKVALIHSEVSEMLEAHRDGNPPIDKDITITDPKCATKDDPVGTRRLTSVEEEMADIIIRVADLAGKLKIDLGRVVLAKMQYNAGRPHKHGKAY